MLVWEQAAGLMAAGALVSCLVAMRLLPRRESTARPASPQSGVQAAPMADRPSPRAPVPASMAQVRGPIGDDPPFRMQMNAHAHAVEFLRWMRDHGFAGRYSAADLAAYYDWFVVDFRVFPLPHVKLLEAVNKMPTVKKSRDRIKDPQTGKVVKLASGSPMRTMFYTIAEEAVHVPAGVSALGGKRSPQRKAAPIASDDDIFAGLEREAA